MPNLNIYVTDELNERLAVNREGPDKLNLSRVCADALVEALDWTDRRRAAAEGPRGREERLARLRLSRAAAHQQGFETGKTAGLQYSDMLEYDEFRQVASIDLAEHKDDIAGLYGELPEIAHDHYETDHPSSYGVETVDRDLWAKGWVTGVQEVWADLKRDL